MCGRFTLASAPAALQQTFFDFDVPINLSPRYNISPTQDVAVIANTSTGTEIQPEMGQVAFFHWGLIPSWAKDPKIGNRMINARSETLAEKPSFRNAYKRRRCLILSDGYYEWKQVPGNTRKQPVYIRLQSEKPFALAGLWETWQAEGMDEPIRSCTIITCPPNALLEKIHHRMPVILPQDAYAEWLSPDERSADVLQRLLVPYANEEMEAYPVSTFVNRPTNDSPECIAPFEVTQPLN